MNRSRTLSALHSVLHRDVSETPNCGHLPKMSVVWRLPGIQDARKRKSLDDQVAAAPLSPDFVDTGELRCCCAPFPFKIRHAVPTAKATQRTSKLVNSNETFSLSNSKTRLEKTVISAAISWPKILTDDVLQVIIKRKVFPESNTYEAR